MSGAQRPDTNIIMSTEIKEYWNQRAKQAAESPTATTDDVHLRNLEVRTFVEAIQRLGLPDGSTVVDVGCGDGFTTLHVAEQLPKLKFAGVDYSEEMIATAHRRLADISARLGSPVVFRVGDATALEGLFPAGSLDVVLTDRCLINLTSPEAQYDALGQIHALLKPGGSHFAIENFTSGQEALNQSRAALGLNEIPVRWHNLFFNEDDFLTKMRALHSKVEIVNFSSAYYYATRVIYSKYCQMRGEVPDYQHEIHQLAVQLPPMGAFSPIKLAVMIK
jgi:ubiquinone/menaquinone biosynthesis C-methylase UbiE